MIKLYLFHSFSLTYLNHIHTLSVLLIRKYNESKTLSTTLSLPIQMRFRSVPTHQEHFISFQFRFLVNDLNMVLFGICRVGTKSRRSWLWIRLKRRVLDRKRFARPSIYDRILSILSQAKKISDFNAFLKRKKYTPTLNVYFVAFAIYSLIL